MAPTATDYLHGLRRLWWVPLATVLVGIGLGLWASSDVRPTAMTSGNALFTFRIADPGADSAGSAREAEAQVAMARLAGYVELARSSPEARALLDSAGVVGPPTTLSSSGGFQDGGAVTLIDVTESGLVEIRVRNGDLSQSEANRLVQDLSREVVKQAVATDTQQVTPSLQPDALITEPQAKEESAPRVAKGALPVLLMFSLGLGIVYLLVWRQGRIYGRRDVEQRLGARVLGDLSGRVADAPAIALALCKGREPDTAALLVLVGRPTKDLASTGVIEKVAAAGRDLGLHVTVTAASQAIPSSSTVPAGATLERTATRHSQGGSLTLIDTPGGLDADSLRAAASVDIVALIVAYGQTSYGELSEAGQTLAEVGAADIAVIGASRRPQ